MKEHEKRQMEELEAEKKKFEQAQKQATEFARRMLAGGIKVDHSAHDEPTVGFPRDWSVDILFRVKDGHILHMTSLLCDYRKWKFYGDRLFTEGHDSPEGALLAYADHALKRHAEATKKIKKERRELEVLGAAVKAKGEEVKS